MIHIIKNITTDKYLTKEVNGKAKFGKYNRAIIFFDEEEAEATLEMLNDRLQSCLVMIPLPETTDELNNTL